MSENNEALEKLRCKLKELKKEHGKALFNEAALSVLGITDSPLSSSTLIKNRFEFQSPLLELV